MSPAELIDRARTELSWSDHALARMEERNIEVAEVVQTVAFGVPVNCYYFKNTSHCETIALRWRNLFVVLGPGKRVWAPRVITLYRITPEDQAVHKKTYRKPKGYEGRHAKKSVGYAKKRRADEDFE